MTQSPSALALTPRVEPTVVEDQGFRTTIRGGRSISISQLHVKDGDRATVMLDSPEVNALIDHLVKMGLVTRVS